MSKRGQEATTSILTTCFVALVCGRKVSVLLWYIDFIVLGLVSGLKLLSGLSLSWTCSSPIVP